MKKLISIMGALAVFVSLIAAAPEPANASYIDGVKQAGLKVTGSASNVVWNASSDVVHCGNYSVFIGAEDAGEYEAETALVFPFAKTLTSGTAYKLSYYTYRGTTDSQGEQGGACGSVSLSNSQVLSVSDMTFYLSDDKTAGDMRLSDGYQLTQVQESGVWAKTEVDFTPTGNVTSLRFNTKGGARYFDDICVTELSNGLPVGKNLVMNGNCETVLDFDRAQYPTGWTANVNQFNDGSKDFTNPNGIQSTAMDAHSGDRSMFVNISSSLSTVNVTGRFTVDLTEKLKAGTKYKFEYWQKNTDGSNCAPLWGGFAEHYPYYIVDNLINWKPDANNSNGVITWNTTENNWRKQEIVWTNSAARSTVGLIFWDAVSALIDDVKLYELDANGNVVKEIPVPNGDFEDYLDFYSVLKNGAENDNWKVTLHSLSGTARDYVRFEEVSDKNYAMHIRYNDRIAGNVYVEINSGSNAEIESGKTYTVEYDLKQSNSWEQTTIRVFPFKAFDYNAFVDHHDLTYLGNSKEVTYKDGWYHVKKEFTSTVSGDEKFTILIQAAGDAVFDNIKVYANDNPSVNLVKDGDFSGTKAYYTNDLENVVAYPAKAGNAATVSWVNAYNTIENTEFYLDGEKQNVKFKEGEGEYNEIYISGLTAGKTYTAEVRAKVGGVQKTYTDTVTIRDSADAPVTETDYTEAGIGDYESGVWKSCIRDGAGYANTVLSVEEEDGNGYARLRGNLAEVKKNTYAGIEQTVRGLSSKKLYKLTFRAKSDSCAVLYAVSDTRQTFGDKDKYFVCRGVELTPEWNEYSVVFDSEEIYDNTGESRNYDSRYLLFAELYTGTISIDDIALYEAESDGSTVSENLIADGAFEGENRAMISNPVLTKNGQTVTALSTGEINVEVTAENTENMVLVVATYKNGALYNLSFMQKTENGAEKFDTNITVPDEEGVFSAKIMCWDTLAAKKPLKAVFRIQ
ncbi:MAG: hypothetical protein ACI4DY_05055 [Monoglobaceae bacterium]